ncbi:zinc finger MYM-type protein 1-like [Triticum aestivum]|uniref:zinc finger MYM-type protein 1-like n=1 Tax=Triticum aestivum TaxID=4565 RepID=UPI001D02EC7E|nr:zinc finger MYM-type protein 1-like [Triticum aestivum]
MVELLAEFNPDIAKCVLANAPYGSKYTSPEIQKEILSIFASKIRNHIREEIGDSKFSILVDETCDVAKREQMALVLRFADKGGILQERFFDLIHVANTRSLTLKDKLSFALTNHGFDIQNLRGQGYDGASNMRGDLNGLQALFLQECPYAYYVHCYAHCYAHRLQLALVDASKEVVSISQFFQKLLYIINTVDSSSKRHDQLHQAQLVELENAIANANIETGQGANQIHTLKRPGDTRWGSHFGSVYSLMKMFGAVFSVIQDIAADRSIGSLRADADTCFGYLSSFEFIFNLCLMKEIFEITEVLGQALQKKSQDIVNAVRLVSSTKECLQQLRSDDGYQEFIVTVVEFCTNHSIVIPDFEEAYIMRGGRARHQPNQLTKEHYFRVEIFYATLDTQLFELNHRFNEKFLRRVLSVHFPV